MTEHPNAELERLVAHAHENQDALTRAIQAVLDSVLVIPSGGDVSTGSQAFVPVLMAVDGVPHVAVFTSTERLASVSHLASYAMTMPGRTFIAGLGAEYGILIAGSDGGFSMAPELLASIRAEG